MPLKLNLGLSRKVGEPNYGSRGASVNVEMEVDGSLVAEPDKLKDKIRQVFSLVRRSLVEELNGAGQGHGGEVDSSHGGPPSHGNGQGNDDPGNKAARGATQSQIKALYAITKSQGVNLHQVLRDRYRIGKPEQLSIKEASQLIDQLKSAESGKGG